jgi:hypothetical protein
MWNWEETTNSDVQLRETCTSCPDPWGYLKDNGYYSDESETNNWKSRSYRVSPEQIPSSRGDWDDDDIIGNVIIHHL